MDNVRFKAVKDTGDFLRLEYGEQTSRKGDWRCFPKAQMEKFSNRDARRKFPVVLYWRG